MRTHKNTHMPQPHFGFVFLNNAPDPMDTRNFAEERKLQRLRRKPGGQWDSAVVGRGAERLTVQGRESLRVSGEGSGSRRGALLDKNMVPQVTHRISSENAFCGTDFAHPGNLIIFKSVITSPKFRMSQRERKLPRFFPLPFFNCEPHISSKSKMTAGAGEAGGMSGGAGGDGPGRERCRSVPGPRDLGSHVRDTPSRAQSRPEGQACLRLCKGPRR